MDLSGISALESHLREYYSSLELTESNVTSDTIQYQMCLPKTCLLSFKLCSGPFIIQIQTFWLQTNSKDLDDTALLQNVHRQHILTDW